MKKWKHINFEQRKAIVSGITHNKKLCEIASIVNLDPTSISKEVKRNRIFYKYGRSSKNVLYYLDGLTFVPIVVKGTRLAN